MKNNGVAMDRFAEIKRRYEMFVDNLADPNIEPQRVFDPLPKKALDELLLIRSVSKDLQAKKDEDVRKAAQAAEEHQQEQAKESEVKEEEKQEKEN